MAEIEVTHIQEFKSNIRLENQKTTFLMEPYIGIDTDVKGEGYRPEMTAGRVAYQRRDTRFEPKVGQEVPMYGRWIEPFDFDIPPIYEDKLDRVRNGMEVSGTYVQGVSAAIRRSKDDLVLAAAFGSAKTGKNGSGAAATFDTANMRVVSGSAGMTINKTIAAMQILKAMQNDLRAEKPWLTITEKQWANLLRDTQVTSSEFQGGHVLKKGEVEEVLGFSLIEFPSAEYDYKVSAERRCLFGVKSGLRLADYDMEDPTVQRNTNMRGHPWEVYAMWTQGASRLDEKRLGEILCAE